MRWHADLQGTKTLGVTHFSGSAALGTDHENVGGEVEGFHKSYIITHSFLTKEKTIQLQEKNIVSFIILSTSNRISTRGQ